MKQNITTQLQSILKTFLSRVFKVALSIPKRLFVISILVVAVGLLYYFLITAPAPFPDESIIRVESGAPLIEISDLLEEKSVVRSAVVFQFFAILLGGDKQVLAGDYFFEKKISVFSVASRLSRGDYQLEAVKITIPEGFTLREMADLFAGRLELFDRDEFLELTRGEEGYLFPDTYFFLPTAEAPVIVFTMMNNFEEKIALLQEDIRESGRSLDEIITMASIIEKETGTKDDRAVISGILWKRIRIGMPLQVDASFLYINGKGSFELTLSDLKIDSPYNTYKYKGLTPGPIASPGMESIIAAVNPKDSPYLYYLHDKEMNVHYGKDFEEHKANKRKYLK